MGFSEIIAQIKSGAYKTYYQNGKVKNDETFKNGKKVGTYKYYAENGKLLYEENFNDNGLKEGITNAFYENGQLESSYNYRNGEMHGVFKEFYEDGKLKDEGKYEYGQRKYYPSNTRVAASETMNSTVENHCFVAVDIVVNSEGNVIEANIKDTNTTNESFRKSALDTARKREFDTTPNSSANRKMTIRYKFNAPADIESNNADKEVKPFTTVEQMPQFKGGDTELMKFIGNNLKYPIEAQEAGIQGKVTVRFIVDENGNVTNPQIIRGIDPACDREALRIIKLMPQWVAGKQNGQNVPVEFTLPILFRLSQ